MDGVISNLDRYRGHCAFIGRSYPLAGGTIEMDWSDFDHANARVMRTDVGYRIDIARVFPALIHALFLRLLSDPEVLPWLPNEATDSDEPFVLPFVFQTFSAGAQCQ